MPPPLPQVGIEEGLLYTQEEEKLEFEKIYQLMLDPKNLAHNTELTKSEITAFSVVSSMLREHPKALHVLDKFLTENMAMRVSHKRGGRREWFKAIARHAMEQDMQAQANRRLFGRGRAR